MEPTLNDLQRTRFRRYMQCKIAKEREKSEEGRQREKGRVTMQDYLILLVVFLQMVIQKLKRQEHFILQDVHLVQMAEVKIIDLQYLMLHAPILYMVRTEQ